MGTQTTLNAMKNLLFNLDSVETSYGDNVLNSILQIDERITDIDQFLAADARLNDFERTETRDRLEKLIQMNRDIQMELERQVQKLEHIKLQTETVHADFDPESRFLINYK